MNKSCDSSYEAAKLLFWGQCYFGEKEREEKNVSCYHFCLINIAVALVKLIFPLKAKKRERERDRDVSFYHFCLINTVCTKVLNKSCDSSYKAAMLLFEFNVFSLERER